MLSVTEALSRKRRYLNAVKKVESRGLPVSGHLWEGSCLSGEEYKKLKPYLMRRHQTGHNRVCVSLKPYMTKTGRNAPLTQGNPLALGSNFRKRILIPDPGHRIIEVDYKCQELGIAAALSGDAKMKADYSTGDFYLAVGKRTELTTTLSRNLLKKGIIMACYGASTASIAKVLVISEELATHLKTSLESHYFDWAGWRREVATQALKDRVIACKDFRWQLDRKTKIGTLLAWMPQAVGAEIMRSVVIQCSNLPLIGVIHDSFLIHSPAELAGQHLTALQKAMRNASRWSLGDFTLKVDTDIYPQLSQES